MRASILILFLLSLIGPWGSSSAAQTASAANSGMTPAGSPAAYASEPLVIRRLSEVYRMEADGTGVYEKTVEVNVQAESALKQLAVIEVPFAAKSQRVEWVYARLRHKDGSVTETPLDGAQEAAPQITREAPFYSDLKQSQLPLKDLRVGDRLEWKARVVRTVAEGQGQFWEQAAFVSGGVVLEQTIELNAPRSVQVNAWSHKGKLTESDEGDRHRWVWTNSELKATVGAEADAAKEAEKKRPRTAEEEIDERQGKLPDVAWTTFKSWEEVGAWYRGLEGERMVPDAEIKAKVAQLTAGKTTQQEKVQAVYSYVATQIHYIGVAFGVGRYQPHSAADVLGNQYGDCKDKHTLLAAMLKTLGLEPDAVLIGAGIRFNEAVPSPAAFNHLITRIQSEGKPVWLDATAEVAPFGMLTYPTRDHEALVVPEAGVAKVMKTPARPPFVSLQTMESVGKLDADGVSNSKLTLTFRGDGEILVRAVLRQVSPAQYDQLAQQICLGMGYTGTASHLETSRPEDTAEALKMSLDYRREKAGDWSNLRTIPQLSPVELPRPDEKTPPVESLELGVPRVEVSKSAMTLPEGWSAEMPEAVHVKSQWATYDETYRFEKGTFYAERKVEILQERVPLADWRAYSKFAEKADIGNESYVQLIRKPGGKGAKATPQAEKSPEPAGGEISSTDTSAIVEDAYQALQRHDLASAQSMLDKVLAIDPSKLRLWGCYGDLELLRGEPTKAIRDYEKELSLHPASVQVYPVIVRVELTTNRRAEAKDALRRWAEAEPENSRPPLQLASLQLEDGNAAEAVATASAAIRRTARDEQPSEQLQLVLGRAQLKAGMKDQGHNTLLGLMKKTDNPDLMNDAAYELADAGMELPLAEETTRTALTKMEEESRTWTLDEQSRLLRARTQMLQATWDTAGWIAFRQGKLAVAEQYVKASWQGRQSLEVGKHLGEIALAKGDNNAALTDFEMASEALPDYDAMGVRVIESPAQKALDARAKELEKQGAHAATYDARAMLERMRKLPLGAGENGVAEYKLLVNAKGLVRAEPTGEKEVPGAMAKLKNARFKGFLPEGSQAQLVFLGMLNCHSGTCELVLEP